MGLPIDGLGVEQPRAVVERLKGGLRELLEDVLPIISNDSRIPRLRSSRSTPLRSSCNPLSRCLTTSRGWTTDITIKCDW